jgi:hypothetical protein
MRALFALVMLLSACATQPAPAPPAVRITLEVSSWGYVQKRWTISNDGVVTLEAPPQGATLGTPPTVQTFALTPADFERVRQSLAPAEAMLEAGVPCERSITDAPYGAVRWVRPDGSAQAIHFDFGCLRNERLDLLYERMDAANDILDEAIGANTPSTSQ